jgi:outer membrane protein OmpA-like peptidoglycan-associated protein
VHSAQLGTPGLLHLSVLASYSYAQKFPEIPGSSTRYSDVSRWIGTFSAAYVFLPWLEVYGSYEVSSSFATMTLSSGTSSAVSGQILGDTHLGVKLAHDFVPSLYAGLDLGLRLFNVGHASNHLRLAFRPSMLLTWNAPEFSPRIPLVLHSNLGLHIGRDARFLSADPGRAIWQSFSWNLNSRHYGFFNLALETPLPYATPFVEYQASFPFWAKEDDSFAKASPQSLVVGAKLTILPNITFALGADINLKSPHIPGIALYPPWRFFIGISLSTAPSSSVPMAQKVTSERQVATISAESPVPPPQLVLALKRGDKFVPGQVYLRGPNPQSFRLTETTSALNIPPGPQLLEALPKEGLAKVKKVNLPPGQTQTLMLDIESAPTSPLVRLVNQRILFVEPLDFSSTKMELTSHGQAQLRGLVDLLLRNHIQKIRIESHVEAQRMEGVAMPLSAQRSQIVVDALVRLGIDVQRIEVLNLGDTKPVAPNTVRRGRMLNRRMDFVVLEKWE